MKNHVSFWPQVVVIVNTLNDYFTYMVHESIVPKLKHCNPSIPLASSSIQCKCSCKTVKNKANYNYKFYQS